MTLHQHILTVAANRPTGPDERHGSATWASGLANPKLISATVLLPDRSNPVATRGTQVRARVDDDLVTVEVSGHISGHVEVLLTLDA